MTAANPAAHEYHLRAGFGPCPTCDDRADRIRALEARVKELTAMLYELRSQRDYAMAIQEDRER